MDATSFFEHEPNHLRGRRWLRHLAMSIDQDEAACAIRVMSGIAIPDALPASGSSPLPD